MKDIFEIVETIKQIKGLQTDNEVAESINVTYDALTNRKARRSIPFKEIVAFCEKEGISLNRIFFWEEKSVVPDETHQMLAYIFKDPIERRKMDAEIARAYEKLKERELATRNKKGA